MELSVIVKVFRLLEALAQPDERGARVEAERSLGELAELVGLPKPTTHRLLGVMVDLGYVRRSKGGQYCLTPKLRELVAGKEMRGLLLAAEPVLARLHKRTGETVNLGVLRNDRVIYLRVLESKHPLRRIAEPDSADPFHCTALGRAIVAHLSPARMEHLLTRAGLERRTPHTVADREELRSILAKVHADGCAIECDQTDVGVTCIGAPVFNAQGVIAAISLSVPSARMPGERKAELVQAVREAAASLTQRLDRSGRERGRAKKGQLV